MATQTSCQASTARLAKRLRPSVCLPLHWPPPEGLISLSSKNFSRRTTLCYADETRHSLRVTMISLRPENLCNSQLENPSLLQPGVVQLLLRHRLQLRSLRQRPSCAASQQWHKQHLLKMLRNRIAIRVWHQHLLCRATSFSSRTRIDVPSREQHTGTTR